MLATVGVLCNKAGALRSLAPPGKEVALGGTSALTDILGANVGETEGRVDESERRHWRAGRGAGGAFREVLAAVRRRGHLGKGENATCVS